MKSFARVFIASDSLLHLVPLDRNSLSRRWPSAPGLSPEKWFPTNMRQAEGPEGPAKACWSSTFQMSKPRDRRWLSPNGFILWHCRGAAMWQTRQAPLCQGRAELTTGPKCGRETCQILQTGYAKLFMHFISICLPAKWGFYHFILIPRFFQNACPTCLFTLVLSVNKLLWSTMSGLQVPVLKALVGLWKWTMKLFQSGTTLIKWFSLVSHRENMDVAHYDVVFCNWKGNTSFELQVLMLPLSSFYAKILQEVG